MFLTCIPVIDINTYGLWCTFIDFSYPDFNETTGLVFVADAGTTNCKFDPLVSITL